MADSGSSGGVLRTVGGLRSIADPGRAAFRSSIEGMEGSVAPALVGCQTWYAQHVQSAGPTLAEQCSWQQS